MGILLRWLISALIILIISHFLPGFHVEGFYTALMVSLFLGLLNATIRPILVFATLPFTIVTLGLWLFVLNAFVLWFISTFLKGFVIDGFGPALIGAALISIAGWFMTSLLKK